MQHEGEPFGGPQRVEYDEQGHAHGVGEHRLLFGVPAARRTDDGIGDPCVDVDVEGLLALSFARAEQVQTDPGDDRGQPSGEVLDAARVGAADARPGLPWRASSASLSEPSMR